MLSALGLGMLVLASCKHKCCRSDGSLPPPSFLPPGPGSTIPPANVPINPGAVPALPPPDVRPSISGRPAPEILLPDPIAPGGTSSQKKASDGILGGPVNAVPLASTLEPPIAAKSEKAAPASNGLPGFTQIKDGVATGGKPTLDGFDTLKKDGYKTIVYLHAPGTDVAAVRDLAETRGLTFVAIEATPEKLGAAFEQLTKATAEKSARPAYVFADDGPRLGAVWYLHFKTVDLESADVSKIRARALGLADDSDFWTEIKKYLAK
jgi:protein tyrosine phosphatase (PTP) superfamily phosphohydrolase (DUF442 family)